MDNSEFQVVSGILELGQTNLIFFARAQRVIFFLGGGGGGG